MLGSGSIFEIVLRSSLTPLEVDTLRIAPHSHCLDTASRQLLANEAATIHIRALQD